uniref:Biogenesis of lysosome-related organelles complex 1 subunit 7 n=1 Tax=Angiostrongylus cantonensis TaxID=6313 RepID=A0A0K0DJX8_ANGCA
MMTSTSRGDIALDNGDLMFASIGSFIEGLEEQIRATRASQIELNERIKEMADFLHELNDHEEPYDIQVYVGKLQDSRRRVNNVNQVIGSVHDRLSRLQRLIAREIFKKKKMIKGTEVPPLPEH